MKTGKTQWTWWVGGLGLMFVVLSIWQIRAASAGLTVRSARTDGLPLIIFEPQMSIGASPRPVILLGHGFAGSGSMMRGYALTMAHAGYVAVVWDFDGHGANPASLRPDGLIQNPERALAYISGFIPAADPDRVAIVGHSMGSGVAMNYGQAHPETAATIAVSPVRQDVNTDLPRSLLLLAGALEKPFIRNAEEILDQAGGPGGDLSQGTARQLVIIPGVEHVSIVFSPRAHAEALRWVQAVFGVQPGAAFYRDARMAWYVLGVLGALSIAFALAPFFRQPAASSSNSAFRLRWFIALLAGALVGTFGLWLVSLAGLGLANFLGLLVGGYLLLWFGLSGSCAWLLAWLLNRHTARPARLDLPSPREMIGGLVAFLTLWLGIGVLGHFVWINWLLIPKRLALWPLGGLLLLPWFYGVGQAQRGASFWGRFVGWLLHALILFGGLYLALSLNPALGFLILILPIFPLVLGLLELSAGPQRDPWPYAFSGALFVSWMLLAVFPLQ